MTKTYLLRKYGDATRSIVTVTLRGRPHWNTSNPKMRAYDVLVKDDNVGHIERATENTDRHYGRIRVPGKGRPAWAWHRKDGTRNYPGNYARNRANAIARVLGYDYGEVTDV